MAPPPNTRTPGPPAASHLAAPDAPGQLNYILSPCWETDSGVRGDDRVADLFQSVQVLRDYHAI